VPYRQDQHQRFLEAIRCPVLSIHPEHSPFAVEDVARVEACIPDLRVATVAGAGHMLPLDAPEAVASLIEEFLQAN
jgi:pimeloyl-ACP methyl ester carboxylesterase